MRRGEISQKELQKLRRVDLLELLLDATRENEEQATAIAELTDLSERLKVKLNEKDAQIEHLKQRLNLKDDEIEHLHRQNAAYARSVGSLDVHELMEVQRIAVERYLEHLKATGAAGGSAGQYGAGAGAAGAGAAGEGASRTVDASAASAGASQAAPSVTYATGRVAASSGSASQGQAAGAAEKKGFLGGRFGR